MNHWEYAAQNDAGRLDAAYKIFNEIRDLRSGGHYGHTLRKTHYKDLELLREFVRLTSDYEVREKINKLVVKIEDIFKSQY